MKIKCKFCYSDIEFDLKLASEDFNDDYRGCIDNFRANTELEPYNPSRDYQDKPLYYLDKGTKKYKPRTDLKQPYDDMQGISNIAVKVGDTALIKCQSCGLITVADWAHPEKTDTYHNDPYSFTPGTDPTAKANTVVPDYDRVSSSTDITPDSIVNKIKKRLKFTKEDQKNDKN